MEVDSNYIKGSKNIVKFLDSFSCYNCKEIGNFPYILKCNHIYCENCVANKKLKQSDGSLVCLFCGFITKKNEILPEIEVRLLLCDLKSIDDAEFQLKYESKLRFIKDSCIKSKINLRNILSFLINFNYIKGKKINNNEDKIIYKRTYLEFKKETFLPNKDNIYEAMFQPKPVFKYN